MIVWKHPFDFVKNYQPAGIIREHLGGLNALIRQNAARKLNLLVPSHSQPLRTLAHLHELTGRNVAWRLMELADDGTLSEISDAAPVQWHVLSQAEYRRAIKPAQPA